MDGSAFLECFANEGGRSGDCDPLAHQLAQGGGSRHVEEKYPAEVKPETAGFSSRKPTRRLELAHPVCEQLALELQPTNAAVVVYRGDLQHRGLMNPEVIVLVGSAY